MSLESATKEELRAQLRKVSAQNTLASLQDKYGVEVEETMTEYRNVSTKYFTALRTLKGN